MNFKIIRSYFNLFVFIKNNLNKMISDDKLSRNVFFFIHMHTELQLFYFILKVIRRVPGPTSIRIKHTAYFIFYANLVNYFSK